jgi:hypothetical protein
VLVVNDPAAGRERSYSQLGLFYLHDIHGKGRSAKEDNMYTIDPTIYGGGLHPSTGQINLRRVLQLKY